MKPTRPAESPWNVPKRRPTQKDFSPMEFFQKKGVFRREEFIAEHVSAGRRSSTSTSLLKYHVAQGTLVNLRRGLYCLTRGNPDPWTVASKVTEDAVLAYDGAASFLHLMPLGHSMTVLSSQRLSDFTDNDLVYTRVAAVNPRSEEQVLKVLRGHNELYVTTRERTLVDLLDRPELGRSISDIVAAFRNAGPLNLDGLVKRARTLGSHTTAARLGFFLEHLGPQFKPVLPALERLRPTVPLYFNRAERKGQHALLSRWNLVAPLDLVLRLERGT